MNQPDISTTKGKIAVMQAAVDGKRTEYSLNGGADWRPHNGLAWQWTNTDYRIHPDDLNPKKLRPWRAEEVPLGAWLRDVQCDDRMIIIHVSSEGLFAGQMESQLGWGELAVSYAYSTDKGKTWSKCGVLE